MRSGPTAHTLASLRRHYPAYADILSLLPASCPYTFEPAGSAVGCRDAAGRWVHGPVDPWEAARHDAERLVGESPELYVAIRPGIGYQAFAILEAIERRAPGSVLLVVEDRLDLFRAALEIADWAPLLDSERTVLLLGKPETVIEAFFERHRSLSLLPMTLAATPEMVETPEFEALASRLAALSEKTRAALELDLGVAAAVLADRRSRNEPLRVVLAGGDFGYLSAPLASGFRACGCDVEVRANEGDLPRAFRAHEWISQIAGLVPDLVAWANRPELSEPASEALRQMGVANVVWAVDSPRRMKLSPRDLAMTDVFCSYDGQYLSRYGAFAKRSVQLSIAAGVRPLPGCSASDPAWPPRAGPDVSFVGTLGESRIAELRAALERRDPEQLAVLNEIAEGTGDAAAPFEQRTGQQYEGSPCFYIEEMRAMRRRLAILSRVPADSLRIYGGAEWAKAGDRVAPCYAGRPIRYGFDLSSVYYHSRINLNVFHEQCVDSTNSRVYDVLAAGGFLLTEENPALAREFEVGRHLATFSSPDEAAGKIEYFLAHPDEREAIARAGQRHVLEHHTFEKRCRRLVEMAQASKQITEVPLRAGPSR